MTRPDTGHDLATKERLLREATRLFAERGFKKVTVRDICAAARANVAAVNYHFGGKPGLYEVTIWGNVPGQTERGLISFGMRTIVVTK